ncbi:hypothetical protein PPYR_02789 [Photinus pyralis]|uniref:Uncharacterized protein n=1 Tax=Photinus pyralis TaxID=7054 RepID=A0A5N4A115_PHOPY|nr:hypothetical protein PPYR_02789 [Photinus pyralis]
MKIKNLFIHITTATKRCFSSINHCIRITGMQESELVTHLGCILLLVYLLKSNVSGSQKREDVPSNFFYKIRCISMTEVQEGVKLNLRAICSPLGNFSIKNFRVRITIV